MVDIIYKTVKPSHLKKLQILFQAIFIFSDWILIKQIIIPSTPVYCWGKQIFEKMWYERMSNSLLPRAWSQELGREVWVGRSLSKNYSNQCIFTYMNSINLKIFHTCWNIKVWEKYQQAFWREIMPQWFDRNMKGCILEANNQGQGW